MEGLAAILIASLLGTLSCDTADSDLAFVEAQNISGFSGAVIRDDAAKRFTAAISTLLNGGLPSGAPSDLDLSKASAVLGIVIPSRDPQAVIQFYGPDDCLMFTATTDVAGWVSILTVGGFTP